MKRMQYKAKKYEWFAERIGKRIFRDPSTCPCPTCRDVEENGLVIGNKFHATYLADADSEFASDGAFMNYRDIK